MVDDRLGRCADSHDIGSNWFSYMGDDMNEADLIAIEVEWAAISVESAYKLVAAREALAAFWEEEKLKEVK